MLPEPTPATPPFDPGIVLAGAPVIAPPPPAEPETAAAPAEPETPGEPPAEPEAPAEAVVERDGPEAEARSRPPVAGPVAEPVMPTEAPAPAPAAPQLEAVDATGMAGHLVRYRWEDPNGPHERWGLVVAVHTDGERHRCEVLWFAGRSGPIDAAELESHNVGE